MGVPGFSTLLYDMPEFEVASNPSGLEWPGGRADLRVQKDRHDQVLVGTLCVLTLYGPGAGGGLLMRGARGLVLVVLPLIMVAILVRPSVAAPATLVVDEDGKASTLHCNDQDPTYATVQEAVNAATAGDTIKVCPGRFRETVTVDKTLSLR